LRGYCRLRVLENGGLKKTYGPKRKDVTGERRRLHNKELYDLYSSANIVRVITSSSRWVGCVDVHVGFWSGDLRERDHLENIGIDGGGLILKWAFKKWDGLD